MASPAAGTELISGQNPHKKVPAQIVMAQFFARPNAYVHFMAVCTQLADVSSYTKGLMGASGRGRMEGSSGSLLAKGLCGRCARSSGAPANRATLGEPGEPCWCGRTSWVSQASLQRKRRGGWQPPCMAARHWSSRRKWCRDSLDHPRQDTLTILSSPASSSARLASR